MNRLVPLLIKLVARLPLAWTRFLGVLLGKLTWLLQPRLATHTQDNIAHCLPELSADAQRQLAVLSLQETLKNLLEAGAIWRHSWPWLERKILAREGEELLRAKLAEGRGLLVLAPHLGNWEVIPPYLASLGPLTAMYKPFSNPRLDALVRRGRSKLNITLVPTNSRGVLQLLKALQAGSIVVILPDHVPDLRAGGVIAPFFNRPVQTMTLVHGLIQRTGCAVCSCFIERIAGGFKARSLAVDPRIYAEDLHSSATGLNASVEACVRLVPTQFQWGYKRFRHLPEPYPNIYRK